MPSLDELDLSGADAVEKEFDELDLSGADEIEAEESGVDLGAMGRGYAQGATFGFGDELSALAETGVGKFLDLFKGEDQKLYKGSLGEQYEKTRGEFREIDAEARERAPISFGVGEFAGGAVSSALPAGAAGRLAGGTGRLAKAASAYNKAGVLPSIGRGGLEAGLYGAGVSEGENLKDIAKDTGQGALIGGSFAGVLSGGGKLANALFTKGKSGQSKLSEFGLKKIGKIFANIDEDVTEQYLKNPKKFAKIQTIEELKDNLDNAIAKQRAGVEGAEAALKEADSQFKAAVKDLETDLKIAKGDLKGAEKQARFELKNKEAPERAIGEVEDTLKGLKQKVIRGSDEAFEILENETKNTGARFNRKSIEDLYQGALDSLKIEGAPPPTGGGRKAFSSIQSELERIRELPEAVEPSSVKKLIKALDDDIWGMESASDFVGPEIGLRRQIRRGLDEGLKEFSPGYRARMESLADDTKLLSELNKKFGTREKIARELYQIDNPKKRAQFRQLSDAAKRTDSEIGGEIADFKNVVSTTRNPEKMRALFDDLPEAQRVKEIENALEELQRSGRASVDILKAQRDLAKKEFRRLGLTEKSSESIVKAFERGNPNIEQIRAVEKVAPDLMEELQRSRVGGAFLRSDTQGSRKTVLGALLGRLFAAGVGGTAGAAAGGEYGAGMGALAGFSADRYAGRVFQSLLNAYAKTPGFVSIASKLPKKPEILEKYGRSLVNAARQGGNALAVRSYVLAKQDPEFAELMKKDEAAENEP